MRFQMIFWLIFTHLPPSAKNVKTVNHRQNKQQQGIAQQKIAAHRGVSAHYPENTFSAFDAARQASVHWIETDVSMLEDETLIIFHDDRQGRTVSGDKLVAESVWADFAAADAGLWKGKAFAGQNVPTLAELLVWQQQHDIGLNLEIKCHGGRQHRTAHQLSSVLTRAGTDDLIISSFDLQFLSILRQLRPDLCLASIHDEPVQVTTLLTDKISIDAAHLNHRLIQSAEDVAAFHEKGLDVRVWTVNDADRAARLFGWGVDMVISDDPEQFRTAVTSLSFG